MTKLFSKRFRVKKKTISGLTIVTGLRMKNCSKDVKKLKKPDKVWIKKKKIVLRIGYPFIAPAYHVGFYFELKSKDGFKAKDLASSICNIVEGLYDEGQPTHIKKENLEVVGINDLGEGIYDVHITQFHADSPVILHYDMLI